VVPPLGRERAVKKGDSQRGKYTHLVAKKSEKKKKEKSKENGCTKRLRAKFIN